jgi:uncharacterized cupredoxin-like copper-binding protein
VKLGLALLAGLAAMTAVVGCGGTSSGPPAGSIVVKETEYKFDPNQISHKAGTITFFVENNGTTAHDLAIFDSSGKEIPNGGSPLLQPGNDETFIVTIDTPGTYPFWCTQPGHKDSGMTGTLTVT